MEKKKKPLKCELLSCIWLSATAWTAAHQAPLSIRFPRHEYWSGLLFPSLGDLPDPEIKCGSPALQADSVLSEPPELRKMGMGYIWVHWAMVCQVWVRSVLSSISIEPWFAKSEFDQYVSMVSSISKHLATGSIHMHGAVYVNCFKNQSLAIALYGIGVRRNMKHEQERHMPTFRIGSECNLLD